MRGAIDMVRDRTAIAGGTLAAALLHGTSIEVLSRDPDIVESCAAVLPPGTEVYVAFGRSGTHDSLAEVCIGLRAAGFVPVPHLVARSFAGIAALDGLLARLQQGGVDHALVIGGDMDRPAGPYRAALDLLLSGALPRHGFRRVGVACYPEPHRRIDGAKLDTALSHKLSIIAQQGMDPWLVSQFCLEAAPIVALAEALRRRGITAPLRIGIAGPTDRRTLWVYALRCGIGASIRALGTHIDAVRDILLRDTPDALLADLARGLAGRPDLGIAGLHIFSFGGLASAASWIDAVRHDRRATAGVERGMPQ